MHLTRKTKINLTSIEREFLSIEVSQLSQIKVSLCVLTIDNGSPSDQNWSNTKDVCVKPYI